MSESLPEARFRLLVESVRDYAIFMLDVDGRVLTWNPGAMRFKGYRAEEIVGRHFSVFYPAEARAQGVPERELEVAARVGSFEEDGWRVRKDGTLFWANVVITAMRDTQGQLLGYAKVTRDLTERRQHEEELRLSEERFRLLVEGVADYAIFMLDPNGNVATWNVGAQRIKGYAASEIIGRHFSVFYPPDVVESGWPAHELQVATEEGRFVDNGWRVRKDGTLLWANVTITALRDRFGHLLGFAKLTRDLSERKRAEALALESQEREELLEAERTARIAAQRAARIKDEFVATVSHELRTPLSAILGWTQLLRRGVAHFSTAELQRAIEVIDRNARAQTRLIDDLLDLGRIMAGKVRLELQPIALPEVVRAAVESVEPAAAAKDIRLTVTLAPLPAPVSADGGRLQQVVWNLLSNAVKFTPKGGQIEVRLQCLNAHVELSVRDSGIGISAAFLPHVFDRFSQKDSSTTRAFGGLGLGLAICKQLVELHGGTIWATSPGEGQGATFVVRLPTGQPQAAGEGEAAPQAHPTAPAAPATEGGTAALPSLAGAHVFVVDDEPDARELQRKVFEAQGAQVSTFASGALALDALNTARPAIIVCDVGMPGMDGYQFMRSVRAGEPRRSHIPALALTAFARIEDRKLSLLAGYQAHLVKPFDVGELVLTVARLIGR